MFGFLKQWFGDSHVQDARDPGDMPIEDAWEEFVRTVRPSGKPKIAKTLSQPDFAYVKKWLMPPTNCPMAKSAMRALIGVQRSRQWKRLSRLELV